MKSRKFESKFFNDPWVESLSLEARYVYIYYLFNSKVNWLGCYEISDRQVLFEIGNELTISSLQKIKDKFAADGKIIFYKHYVILVNSEKYENHMNNIQLMRTAFKQYNELSEEIQKEMFKAKPRPIVDKYTEIFSILHSSLRVDEGQGQGEGQGEGQVKGDCISDEVLERIKEGIK